MFMKLLLLSSLNVQFRTLFKTDSQYYDQRHKTYIGYPVEQSMKLKNKISGTYYKIKTSPDS